MAITEMPIIDRNKCGGCGLCASVCACGALVMEGTVVKIVETENCHWCLQCELVCPTGALTCSFEIVIE